MGGLFGNFSNNHILQPNQLSKNSNSNNGTCIKTCVHSTNVQQNVQLVVKLFIFSNYRLDLMNTVIFIGLSVCSPILNNTMTEIIGIVHKKRKFCHVYTHFLLIPNLYALVAKQFWWPLTSTVWKKGGKKTLQIFSKIFLKISCFMFHKRKKCKYLGELFD